MQRIERYGVIALVFLLVTILAVAVWGQRKNQSLMSFLKRDKNPDVAKLDVQNPGGTAPGGLGLSSPSHELSPLAAEPQVPAGPTDTALVLNAPAGPGVNAVSFDQGSQLTPPVAPGAGFVDPTTRAPGSIAQPPPSLGGQTAPAADVARTYKVKNGDTLGSIAQHELGSTKRWTEIAALNGVQPEKLAVGMTLKLPQGTASTEPQTLVKNAPAVEAPSAGKRTYSVRSGDSLSKIAAAQLGDADRFGEIQALNPGVDPKRLFVGQSLRLPAGAKAQASQPKAKSRGTTEVASVSKPASAPKKARVQ
ncbi:MAG TPA: LysM peptidoglycan-binding domain-containing protein [Planctomycetota bacterium]|nr:LysM peptidoglycan-binding domain-containing protein [Planctomycetota bacterium]